MHARSLASLVGALLVGILVGGAAYGLADLDLFGGRGPGSSAPLVDATLLLRSEGTTYAFTVPKPGPIRLSVGLPPGCQHDADVSLSPVFVAMRPGLVYEPEEQPEHRLKIPATGVRDARLELHRAGAYVLRIEPIPMAMGNGGGQAKARVEIRPAP